jgi:hypothetical protein
VNRRSFALLLLTAVICLHSVAQAEPTDQDLPLRRASGSLTGSRVNVGPPGQPDTIWVGYSTGPGVNNYWSVGAGVPRPGPNTSSQNNTNGLWTFDHPVHGDSLQGWWPVREPHTNVSGPTLPDVKRAWWAAEVGNQADYVLNEAQAGRSNVRSDRCMAQRSGL